MKLIALLIAFAMPSLLVAQDLSENLLLHYPFNGDLLDISGNEYHGQSTNITFAEDQFGNANSAANFNGLNTFVELPNVDELKPELPVSMAFWIKYDSEDPTQRVVFNTSYQENYNMGVHMTTQSATGKFALGFGDGSAGFGSDSRRTFVCEDSVEVGEWQHIAIVVNGAEDMKIYINCHETQGVYSGTGGNIAYASLPGTIGKHDQHLAYDGYFFKGQISELYYWNREVFLFEFAQLCNPVSVAELGTDSSNKFQVAPNPNVGQFSIHHEGVRPTTIMVQSMMGKALFYLPYSEYIALDEIESGLYLVRLLSNLGEVIGIERMVIAR